MGQHMSHYILPDGHYRAMYRTLQARGLELHWQSALPTGRRRNKWTFICPKCRQNAWAKPHAKLICGHCRKPMEGRDDG